jgi:N-acetylmuramoyl-L-alanine amidase
MARWSRWGSALVAFGVAAAAAGCGQLFSQAQQPVTLQELANRVDSLDAQVGELQAALANLGGSSGGTATAAGTQGSALESGLPVAVVQADVLNVRSEPSLSGTVVGTLLQNTQVNVLAENGNWSEISYTNPNTGVHLTGWVDSDYLGNVSAGTATPAPAGATTAAAGQGTASSASSAGPASSTSSTAASGTTSY